jgi:hypothetical protein
MEDKPIMNYLLIYHFFGLLWTTQFILGFAVMSIAGTVSAWYFSRDPSKGDIANKVRTPITNPRTQSPMALLCKLYSAACVTVHLGEDAVACFRLSCFTIFNGNRGIWVTPHCHPAIHPCGACIRPEAAEGCTLHPALPNSI